MASNQLFFSMPAQRIALARERFFENGDHSSGLVSDAILQSWLRCAGAGQRPREKIPVEPISKIRIHTVMRTSRSLRQAVAYCLKNLESALRLTACRIIITDANGILIYASNCTMAPTEADLPSMALIGVDCSEEAVATTAPGIVVKTGRSCTVSAAEHFNDALGMTYCAAAPIRSMHGQLVGVLNVSIENHGFGFDALRLVDFYATAVENRLACIQSNGLFLVSLQTDPALLDTPLEALLGVGCDGRIRWINDAGRWLVGSCVDRPVEEALGIPENRMVGMLSRSDPYRLELPNRLTVWAKGCLVLPDGVGPIWPVGKSLQALVDHTPAISTGSRQPHAPSHTTDQMLSSVSGTASTQTPEPQALDNYLTLQIERTLQEFGGNVARAAKHLKISRGRIYRRIKSSAEASAPEL